MSRSLIALCTQNDQIITTLLDEIERLKGEGPAAAPNFPTSKLPGNLGTGKDGTNMNAAVPSY